jgi:hypothetical protein
MLELSHQFQAAELRHLEVGDDYLGWLFLKLGKAIEAIRGQANGAATSAEDLPKELADFRFIVDD